MKTLIIPDIHGKIDLFQSMLDEHKDADRIIQLGDLANCVFRDRDGDLKCLERAWKLQNDPTVEYVQLVGNHEIGYWAPQGRFGGFNEIPEVKENIKKLVWLAAAVVGDNLITHAGLHPAYTATINKTPAEAAQRINSIWDTGIYHHPLFVDVGRIRWGADPQGGILWRDNDEDLLPINQIFGHTKGREVRVRGTGTCIDCEKPFVLYTDE